MSRKKTALSEATCMSVLMPTQLMEALAAAAEAKTTSMSSIVRESVRRAVRAIEKEVA